MKTESIVIILPLPLGILSPNFPAISPGGRFAKAGATKKLRRLAKEAVEAEQIETAPWGKVVVDTVFFHAQKRRRDEENALISVKAVYDGVVDSGLVDDDDTEHMNKRIPSFEIDRKCPRVMFTITNSTENAP